MIAPTHLALPESARREDWKFIPRADDGYTAEDRRHCLSQQPISVNGQVDDLPPYLSVLTGGCHDLTVRPPVLRFGWRLEAQDLMAVIRRQFPKYIQVNAGTTTELTEFIDFENNEQAATFDFSEVSHMGECAMTSIYNSRLLPAIIEHLRLSGPSASLLRICVLCDSQGVPGVGLTIGNNYKGVLGLAAQERVCKLFDLDISSAQWYLHPERWYWRTYVPRTPVHPTLPDPVGSPTSVLSS